MEGPLARVKLRARSAPAAAVDASLARLAALAQDSAAAAALAAVAIDVSDSKIADVQAALSKIALAITVL